MHARIVKLNNSEASYPEPRPHITPLDLDEDGTRQILPPILKKVHAEYLPDLWMLPSASNYSADNMWVTAWPRLDLKYAARLVPVYSADKEPGERGA
ncbi:hypothetical protein EYF80_015026 [Liparis tanakae]|uniref:Uncharacterized protein n=1 Tax=Liparis tanakae TaxID=230148 RepID=A0A4Z2I9R7_9TELE|nr:hypothetical protein EYF80_015026 [Liparis tanakae]